MKINKESIKLFLKNILSKLKRFFKKVKDKIKKALHDRKAYKKPLVIEYPFYIIYYALKGFILGFKDGHVVFKAKKVIALDRESADAYRFSGEET